MAITIMVNGVSHTVDVDPETHGSGLRAIISA